MPRKKKTQRPAPKRAVSAKATKKSAKKTAPAPVEMSEAVEVAAESALAPGGKINKTAFVLAQAPELTPMQVAEAAAAEGTSISPGYVSKVRSAAKSASKGAAKKPVKKALAKATKATKRGPGDGSGSAFIRSQPISMKASEVVAAAAAKGITITPGLVYSVRGASKKSGKAPAAPGTKRRGRPPKAAVAAAAAPVAAPGPAAPSSISDRERKLVSLALDVGLARAQELLAEIRSKLAALL